MVNELKQLRDEYGVWLSYCSTKLLVLTDASQRQQFAASVASDPTQLRRVNAVVAMASLKRKQQNQINGADVLVIALESAQVWDRDSQQLFFFFKKKEEKEDEE